MGSVKYTAEDFINAGKTLEMALKDLREEPTNESIETAKDFIATEPLLIDMFLKIDEMILIRALKTLMIGIPVPVLLAIMKGSKNYSDKNIPFNEDNALKCYETDVKDLVQEIMEKI